MPRPSNAYTPEDFVAQLKSGEIEASTPFALMGMVKEAGDSQHLLFASGTDCDTWTELPLSMIESIEVRDVVPCRDHTHPVVKLQLKEPGSDEARAFASLAKAQLLAGSRQAPPQGKMPEFRSPPNLERIWPDLQQAKVAQASAESCRGCFEFCKELTETPDFLDWLWCLNFCLPICPG